MGSESVLVGCMTRCMICGESHPQKHHVFFGTANRKISDKYGYIVPLCLKHHTGQEGVHHNRELNLRLKRSAQEHFEANEGTREDFIKIFGKSYL